MVIDKFGATKEEIQTIEDEMNYLRSLGYKVPKNAIIKFLPHCNGMAGDDNNMYIHPNTDLDELRFVVRHEIGHHNEPEVEFDIWSDDCIGGYLTNEKIHKASEDFANDFARKTAR